MRETFIVKIIDAQNATWQGTVTWVESKKTQSFRSELELIKLINSTLSEQRRGETEVEERI